jgi:zinc/manganese transport system permease protein
MFQYEFMQNAFLAGTIVAIMCGAIGVFVMARGLSFITHSFSHIGFSGATFAVWMGWNPLSGLLLFTTLSALAIGQIGVKFFRREASISVILSVFLGLGILFLTLSKQTTSFTSTILFGSVVGISSKEVITIVILTSILLLILMLGYRMLKFDSFDPIGAEASGLPIRFISIGFLILLSIGVAEAVQIVGALLVFALMTIPAATSRFLTHSVFKMILVSSGLAVLGVWAGLTLSFLTNAPVSFFITVFEALFYFSALGWNTLKNKMDSLQLRA